MDWLEISLSVDGELAESIAEVLSRFAPNGVMMEQGIRHLDDEDVGTPSGPILVRAYLTADEGVHEKCARIENALRYLAMIQPVPTPSYRTLANANWMEAWKEHYRPIPIGRRLMILPAWMESDDPKRIPVKINPGMAFGTGTHPSTQLCLEFLDELIEPALAPPTRFIDVGCGSGILSIAALKLGASAALGVDIESEALSNARENANSNGLGAELILGAGSVSTVLEGRFPFRSAQLVAANILAPVIIRLLEDGLRDLLTPDGHMILAGILVSQEEDVTRACRKAELAPVARRAMGDWVALCVSR